MEPHEQVEAMYSSVANHGFVIRDAVEGQSGVQQFHSPEKGSSTPELVLRFAGAGGDASYGHVPAG